MSLFISLFNFRIIDVYTADSGNDVDLGAPKAISLNVRGFAKGSLRHEIDPSSDLFQHLDVGLRSQHAVFPRTSWILIAAPLPSSTPTH